MRLAMLILTTLLVAACGRDQAEPVAAEAAPQLLINRNWLDRWPAGKDDRLHVYRFVPSMGGGVYHDRTLFVGRFELFQFTVEGDILRIHLPDSGERIETRFHIEEFDGPGPLDLRLTLTHSPRGPQVYYGLRRETSADIATLAGFVSEPPR